MAPPDDGEAQSAMEFAGPPPRSRVAIAGFALALIFLIPFGGLAAGSVFGVDRIPMATYLSAGVGLLATAMGIAGLFITAGRRRRGRGLAIAAIPMGLLAAFLQFGVGFTGFVLIKSSEQSRSALRLLKSPTDKIEQNTHAFYESFASKQFKVVVSEEDFGEWLRQTLDDHGQLQNIEPLKPPYETRQEAIAFRYSGQFVNGTAPITVVMWFDGKSPFLDDIRVRDSSPRR